MAQLNPASPLSRLASMPQLSGENHSTMLMVFKLIAANLMWAPNATWQSQNIFLVQLLSSSPGPVRLNPSVVKDHFFSPPHHQQNELRKWKCKKTKIQTEIFFRFNKWKYNSVNIWEYNIGKEGILQQLSMFIESMPHNETNEACCSQTLTDTPLPELLVLMSSLVTPHC